MEPAGCAHPHLDRFDQALLWNFVEVMGDGRQNGKFRSGIETLLILPVFPVSVLPFAWVPRFPISHFPSRKHPLSDLLRFCSSAAFYDCAPSPAPSPLFVARRLPRSQWFVHSCLPLRRPADGSQFVLVSWMLQSTPRQKVRCLLLQVCDTCALDQVFERYIMYSFLLLSLDPSPFVGGLSTSSRLPTVPAPAAGGTLPQIFEIRVSFWAKSWWGTTYTVLTSQAE